MTSNLLMREGKPESHHMLRDPPGAWR